MPISEDIRAWTRSKNVPISMSDLGNRGEAIARYHLDQSGYEVLESNLETPVGECDLLVRDDNHLVLVEVKTRSSSRFGPPEAAVHEEKQKQLRRIARYLMTEYDDPTIRFDVVAVELEGDEPTIRHLEGAFEG